MFQVYCIHGLPRSIRETGDLFEAIHRPGRSTSNCLNTTTDTEETHIVARLPVIEEEGRGRALRATHSIAERIITELLVMHQNQQQISHITLVSCTWARLPISGSCHARGNIIKVLENRRSFSRKNIVMYVVQLIKNDFPNASKTNIGHVVQLLYRVSCFTVSLFDQIFVLTKERRLH